MLETIIKHDRMVVFTSLIFIITVSWLFLLDGAGMAMNMSAISMSEGWSLSYFITIFIMWWVMMIAMMLPSAAPMILLFATVSKKHFPQTTAALSTAIFTSSYLIMWAFFSLLATMAQWLLATHNLLDMMQINNHFINAALLITAGIYQFTPLKDACLRLCRTPVQFVMLHWMPGRTGAVKMGLLHGTFCLGCCWFLMALLFVGGVMNILWIGGLALYVLIEKLTPYNQTVERIVGIILIASGVVTLLIN